MILPFGAVFVLLFVPLCVLLYAAARALAPAAAVGVLLAASATFYLANDPSHAWLIAGLTVFNYALGKAIARGIRPRLALGAGIVVTIGALAAYKYGLVSAGTGSTSVLASQGIMPLGLSFFALQQVSALLDTARAAPNGPRLGFGRFALYTIFFPQMVAGPILRYDDGIAQYRDLGAVLIPLSLTRGATLMLFGVAKKLLLADPLGGIASAIFDPVAAGHVPSLAEAWIAGWSYLLQLYFDFAALSDVACGIGLMFGLKLPINFNSPLKARNASETFDRWHMSLTAFIRAYVFTPIYTALRRRIPGKAARRSILAWAGATLISLTLVGWWHGARATFVVSGFLIGVTAVLFQLKAFYWPTAPYASAAGLRALGSRLFVLLALLVFGIAFRAPDMASVWRILSGLVDITHLATAQPMEQHVWRTIVLVVPFASAVALFAPNTLETFSLWDHPGAPAHTGSMRWVWRCSPLWAALAGLMLVVAIMCWSDGSAAPVIYGKF